MSASDHYMTYALTVHIDAALTALPNCCDRPIAPTCQGGQKYTEKS